MNYYNISGENDEIVSVSREELLEIYNNYSDQLLQGRAFGEIQSYVLANHKGYITYLIKDTQIIGQCWAGEYTIGGLT